MRISSKQRFLAQWANLKEEDLKPFFRNLRKWTLPVEKQAIDPPPFRARQYLLTADALRQFWESKDNDKKFYLGYRLIEAAVAHTTHLLQLHLSGMKDDEPNLVFSDAWPKLDPETRRPFPLEAAFIDLLKKRRFTAVCKRPDCPSPYYFRTKRGQLYCDDDCRLWASKENKRHYWHKRGKHERKRKKAETIRKRSL